MQIYVLLTENCNLKCDFCIRGKKKGKFIDKKKLYKIAEENDFKKHQVLLTGGEPTLHSDFLEIVDAMIYYSNNVSVNTNGTTGVIKELPNRKKLHIQISLDGTEKVHDSLRGTGSYPKTWENILHLDKKGIQYNISTVVNRNNIERLDDLIAKLQSLKNMEYWKVDPQLPFGCMDCANCVTNEQWNKFVDHVITCVSFKVKIKKLFDFSKIEQLTDEQILVLADKCKKNCGTCKNKIYIYPDFAVYPCTCLKKYKLGNLEKDKLETILQTAMAKQFSEYCVSKNSVCYHCRYLPICNGGCIGMSQYFFGRLGMGDMRCPLIIRN